MKKPAGGGMAPLPPSPPSCKAASGSPRLLHSCSGEWGGVVQRNVKSSLLLLLVLSTFFVFSSLHSSRSFEPEPAAPGGEAVTPSQSTIPGDDDRGNEEEIAVAEKSVAAEQSSVPADISLPSPNSSAAAVPTPNKAEQTGGAEANMEGKCDVSMGKWVRDPTGPVYTYLTCPTMSDYKNCQKYGKDDSHLYWRWQPDGCDLPRFSPEKFLTTVRGKRLAFIGDSLARNQMDSLLCLLSQAETPTNVYSDASDKFKTWRFPEHDFTLMVMWTEFYVHAEPVVGADGKPTSSFNIHLDRLGVNWTRRLPELDFAVISGGNWFNRPNYLWEGGRRVGCAKCHGAASNLTDLGVPYAVRRVVRAAVEGIARCTGCKPGLVTFLRTYSPDHFENGSWFNGGYCNRTRPLEEDEVSPDAAGWELRRVQREEVRRVRETAASGSGARFGVLDVTPAMMMRADGHPGEHYDPSWKRNNDTRDCLHWCMPGPVDMWNEVLLQRLTEISPPAAGR